MYLAPLWIPSDEAKIISDHGFRYLRCFRSLAEQASRAGTPLFLYNTKIHMMTHILRNLEWEAELAEFCLNPLVLGVQLDEDLIGKASRLARHVSSAPYFTIKRTLQRWLIASYTSWSKSGMLQRCVVWLRDRWQGLWEKNARKSGRIVYHITSTNSPST